MRVAIITENFLPKLDGVTHTLARLLKYLQTTGHQVLLLGPDGGIAYYAGAEVIGTIGLPFPLYPELKLNVFRPLFMRRLKEFDPDIIHLVDPVFLGAAGLAATRLLQKPVVSSYHTNLAEYCEHFGVSLLTRLMWSYNRLIHNACSLTFCPSPSTAAKLRLQGFEHVRVWSRGVDTQFFCPERKSVEVRASWLAGRERPETKVILLYVGRVSWEKNLGLLVRAYQTMEHEHTHLVIVGDGPARLEMQEQLAGLPVTFTGYLRGQALATAYASADIFAFPSRTETFGQVVLEAMASGLPVAGLFAEGVRDLVDDGETGYLLNEPRLNEEERGRRYCATLMQLVESKELRTNMGKAAAEEAQTRSWSQAMEQLMDGYWEVQDHAIKVIV